MDCSRASPGAHSPRPSRLRGRQSQDCRAFGLATPHAPIQHSGGLRIGDPNQAAKFHNQPLHSVILPLQPADLQGSPKPTMPVEHQRQFDLRREPLRLRAVEQEPCRVLPCLIARALFG